MAHGPGAHAGRRRPRVVPRPHLREPEHPGGHRRGLPEVPPPLLPPRLRARHAARAHAAAAGAGAVHQRVRRARRCRGPGAPRLPGPRAYLLREGAEAAGAEALRAPVHPAAPPVRDPAGPRRPAGRGAAPRGSGRGTPQLPGVLLLRGLRPPVHLLALLAKQARGPGLLHLPGRDGRDRGPRSAEAGGEAVAAVPSPGVRRAACPRVRPPPPEPPAGPRVLCRHPSPGAPRRPPGGHAPPATHGEHRRQRADQPVLAVLGRQGHRGCTASPSRVGSFP
mmetsp:Transcript_107181/g.303012  ORF Transcript_107181/g.303012 Transcript_107181/m.303012 type:complete len:279 (-) Transcript_107181:1115-1951(-)